MKADEIRVAHSELSDRVYAGKLSKDEKCWTQKKDITSDFLAALISKFGGCVSEINGSNGTKHEITVKEITE